MEEEYYVLTRKELFKLLSYYNDMLALEQMGVDNWDGYEYALKEYYQEKDPYDVVVEDMKDYQTLDEVNFIKGDIDND